VEGVGVGTTFFYFKEREGCGEAEGGCQSGRVQERKTQAQGLGVSFLETVVDRGYEAARDFCSIIHPNTIHGRLVREQRIY
jgi:hypothetical protein